MVYRHVRGARENGRQISEIVLPVAYYHQLQRYRDGLGAAVGPYLITLARTSCLVRRSRLVLPHGSSYVPVSGLVVDVNGRSATITTVANAASYQMRASYNGYYPAFQAGDVGSIPIARFSCNVFT